MKTEDCGFRSLRFGPIARWQIFRKFSKIFIFHEGVTYRCHWILVVCALRWVGVFARLCRLRVLFCSQGWAGRRLADRGLFWGNWVISLVASGQLPRGVVAFIMGRRLYGINR